MENKDKNILTEDDVGYFSGEKYVVPENIEIIGKGAFHVTSIKDIVLPDGLKEIGEYAFKNSWLEKINIPQGVKSIGNEAFNKCSRLTNITLPNGLTHLGEYAFCRSGIKEIEIPNGVKSIETGTFEYSKLKSINLPETLTEIKYSAFNSCELENIVIPNSVTIIGNMAFGFCSNLQNVVLPKNLKNIGSHAFTNCSNLKSIAIPEGITTVDMSTFHGCNSLKEVVLPNSIKTISISAFDNCANLTKINFPSSLENIEEEAFKNCYRLRDVEFNANLKTLGERVFSYCTGLTSLKMPEYLQQIGSRCFASCGGLERIELNNRLRVIDESAFVNCKNLKNINLPDSIVSIGESAFASCGMLEKITLPKNLKILQGQTFSCCNNLKNIEFNEGLEEILTEAFEYCESIEHIKLPKSLKYLGQGAFYNCQNLKTVEMPSTIKEIRYSAFSNCKNLESVIIDGKELKVTNEIIDKFGYVYEFLCYALMNNKFIPNNVNIMIYTCPKEFENFYAHSKEWKNILNNYLTNWKEYLLQRNKDELNFTITNLYQASIALGLFAGGEDSLRAQEFLNNVIFKKTPQELHNIFGQFGTKENGYNKEFADFYIKNFREINSDGCNFLERVEVDDWDREEIVNYTANAYNNWEKVKKAYPNRTVLAHRERGSENNNLSEEDIFNALKMTYYENVDEDNEEMAEIVGKYGYSQKEFEELQKWYNIAKKIEQKDVVLNVGKDNETSGVIFELLEKNNAEALILGEKTNCCQTVNDAGSSCVEYGITKPNSGFVKFMSSDKIVGQSWVWYNEKTGVVCLDNIEVPTIWQKEMHKKEFQTSFINCIKRLANSFKQEMEKNGHKVTRVTIGSGYNDLQGIDSFERKQTSKTVLPEDYNGYSDATSSWYVIPTLQKTSVTEDEVIK